MLKLNNIRTALIMAFSYEPVSYFGENHEYWVRCTSYDLLSGFVEFGHTEDTKPIGTFTYVDDITEVAECFSGKRNYIDEWSAIIYSKLGLARSSNDSNGSSEKDIETDSIYSADEAFEMDKTTFSRCLAVDIFNNDWTNYCYEYNQSLMVFEKRLIPRYVNRPFDAFIVNEEYEKLLKDKIEKHNLTENIHTLKRILNNLRLPF